MVLEIPVTTTDMLYQIGRFFIVLFIGIALTRTALMPLVKRLAGHRSDSKKTVYSLENVAGVIGIFFTVTLALQAGSFGNLVTVIGTVAAALTIAIGFGMRDQVANLVAGIFIQLGNPFVREDYVRVQEFEGTVKEIGLRETRLKGPAGDKLILPNNLLATTPIRNLTRQRDTALRVETTVPLDHASRMADIMVSTAKRLDTIRKQPRPSIRYLELGEGTARLEVQCFVKDAEDLGQVRSDLLTLLAEETAANNIFDDAAPDTP